MRASDRHLRGVVARLDRPSWYPAPRVHDIYIQLCPGDRVEARPPCVLLSRHAQVPGFFLWSSGFRRSRVRSGHPQRPPTGGKMGKTEKPTRFFGGGVQGGPTPFGDFRGRPH
jgi:hypothetical protein